MPDRSGGVPSYTTEAFEPIGELASRHVGGVAAWSYWLGWFPVAPINMILAAAYITQFFGLPSGKSVLPFGAVGSPITVGAIVISFIGIVAMFIPCYLGIKLGAAAATVLGIVSMVPLTLLVVLPASSPARRTCTTCPACTSPAGVHGSARADLRLGVRHDLVGARHGRRRHATSASAPTRLATPRSP